MTLALGRCTWGLAFRVLSNCVRLQSPSIPKCLCCSQKSNRAFSRSDVCGDEPQRLCQVGSFHPLSTWLAFSPHQISIWTVNLPDQELNFCTRSSIIYKVHGTIHLVVLYYPDSVRVQIKQKMHVRFYKIISNCKAAVMDQIFFLIHQNSFTCCWNLTARGVLAPRDSQLFPLLDLETPFF